MRATGEVVAVERVTLEGLWAVRVTAEVEHLGLRLDVNVPVTLRAVVDVPPQLAAGYHVGRRVVVSIEPR
jgi:hypothetical protein